MDKEIALSPDESVIIGSGNVTVTFLGLQGGRVKLGFSCPPDVKVLRRELYERLYGEVPPCVEP